MNIIDRYKKLTENDVDAKPLSVIENYRKLTKSGIRANLNYFQNRMDRLKQELREAQYQYQLSISVYSWMIDQGETHATPDRPTSADGRAND